MADLRLSREYIRPGDRVCAAVSGGADSVAMLLLLHAENALPARGLGVGLSAVHVHHDLRGPEADADAEFVRDLCAKLQVPLHVERASVPERVQARANPRRAETLEEAAREVRYAVFERLICRSSADAVLTAHTLEDQAETVLMKLMRGAWTEGLSGIYPMVRVACATEKGAREGRILRPLLGVRRAELVAYLKAREQSWRTDATNSDETYTRNRVRAGLLPALREYNPGVDRVLANTADIARQEEMRWQTELARVLPQLLLPGRPVRGGGRAVSTGSGEQEVSMEVERLRTLDRALLRRVLRAAAARVGARLNFAETTRLEELALGGVGKPGAKLQFSAGLEVQRTARELRFYRHGGNAPPGRTGAACESADIQALNGDFD